MTHSKTGPSRALALLGVATLAAASVVLIGGPALAAPGDAGSGTLTVHKLEQPDGAIGPNDGTEIDVSGATPLVAGFTVCGIDDLDLSDPAAWNRLANITINLDPGGNPVATENGTALALSCGTEQMTVLPTGATSFELDADAAYVVYESTKAANATTGAQPSLITVPYPGSGAAGQDVWNYSPHLYPKNVLAGSGATKDGSVIGDQVSFDIRVPVNPLGAGETYTELRINDQLADFLTYTGGAVTLTAADGSNVPLTAGTHYTLTAPGGTGGDEVILTMVGAGLELLDANIGGVLQLTIDADATGTGSTANEAQITVNGTSTDPGTGPQTPDPEEFFAGAHLVKLAQNKGATDTVPLAGAIFDVYTAAAAATECPATPDPDETRVLTGQVSGTNGLTPNRVLAVGTYCVYETDVPAGYKGLSGGMLFDVAGEDASVSVVNTQIGADEGDLPQLPLTGATGGILLGVGGAALLLITGLLLNARRKQRQEG